MISLEFLLKRGNCLKLLIHGAKGFGWTGAPWILAQKL
jgi:hypothetical protein